MKGHAKGLCILQAPRGGTTHVNAPRPVQAPSSLAGPKPFSTPSAPTTSPARPAPVFSKLN
ncbi:hypothetical protein C0J52_24527 [Blattella germanica]|nr:hypothetical protein C0J52_24527 [Blattella germanica]